MYYKLMPRRFRWCGARTAFAAIHPSSRERQPSDPLVPWVWPNWIIWLLALAACCQRPYATGQESSPPPQVDSSERAQPSKLGPPEDLPAETQVTQFFGIAASGTRFVYVLDRSASMSDFDGRPLQAAKNELASSLKRLRPSHQFQVIFYNHEPRAIRLAGRERGLLWADDETQHEALRFIRNIRPDGGTEHLAALRAGLLLNPDVLFFLTDADRPQLTPGDLKQIDAWNHGTRILAVEFRAGPQPVDSGILERLAQQTAGDYRYIDIRQLRP